MTDDLFAGRNRGTARMSRLQTLASTINRSLRRQPASQSVNQSTDRPIEQSFGRSFGRSFGNNAQICRDNSDNCERGVKHNEDGKRDVTYTLQIIVAVAIVVVAVVVGDKQEVSEPSLIRAKFLDGPARRAVRRAVRSPDARPLRSKNITAARIEMSR